MLQSAPLVLASVLVTAVAPLPQTKMTHSCKGVLTVRAAARNEPLKDALTMKFTSSAVDKQQMHQVVIQTGTLASTQWVFMSESGESFVWAALPNLRQYVSQSKERAVVEFAVNALTNMQGHWVRQVSKRHTGLTAYVVRTRQQNVDIVGTAWLDKDNIPVRCTLNAAVPGGGKVQVSMALDALQKGSQPERFDSYAEL